MRNWQTPDSQHDIAEFMQHLVEACPGRLEANGVQWASTLIVDGTIQDEDGGGFLLVSF